MEYRPVVLFKGVCEFSFLPPTNSVEWSGILSELDGKLTDGRRYKFSYAGVSQDIKWKGGGKVKLAKLRKRFEVVYLNPYGRMLEKHYIPSKLRLEKIVVEVESL